MCIRDRVKGEAHHLKDVLPDVFFVGQLQDMRVGQVIRIVNFIVGDALVSQCCEHDIYDGERQNHDIGENMAGDSFQRIIGRIDAPQSGILLGKLHIQGKLFRHRID